MLALGWFAYHPGLTGPFLFDDYANLPSLGAFGPVDNFETFVRYITSGSADPTGRPIALLSFLIDANDWPAAPYPFKQTNILLHLLNGALLFWLLYRLGVELFGHSRRATVGALFATTFWLLHPLLVSTTLYVVQRETLLEATFVLLGLIGYTLGRDSAARGNLSGTFFSAFSITACTLLATLCKANGALLPIFALLVESVLLSTTRPIRDETVKVAFKYLRWVFLILPSILVVAFLGKIALQSAIQGVAELRPWSWTERLLTEPRVICDYLTLLWIPRAYTAGLFNDSVVVSRGLFSPPSTAISIAFILTLLFVAFVARREKPYLSLAIFFFFTGHLMESTVVPLELYFEHRNYAPAMLMFWPLGLWIANIDFEPGALRPFSMKPAQYWLPRITFGLFLALGLWCLTFLNADLWGKGDEQGLVWALKNPNSPRAQAYAAQIELDRGQNTAAISRLERALETHPHELQLTLNLIGAKCRTNSLTEEDLQYTRIALRMAPNSGRLGYDWFDRSLDVAKNGLCKNLSLDTLDDLLRAAGENPKTEAVAGRRQDRLNLMARIALLEGHAERALGLFNLALDADVRPGAALAQAAIMASAGYPKLAESHLRHLDEIWQPPTGPGLSMPTFHKWLLWKQGYWTNELAHMHKLLQEDIDKSSRKPDSTQPSETVPLTNIKRI